MVCTGECSLCTEEKWCQVEFYRHLLRSGWLMVLLQPSVASLFFCLVVQSIIECRILNVPSIIVGPFLPSVLSGNKIHIQLAPMQLSSPLLMLWSR